MIRGVTVDDAKPIAEIYDRYVHETIITFELTSVSADEIRDRIDRVLARDLPWIVAEGEDGRILGYAYADAWRTRIAYRHTVETAVYLDPDACGRGIGSSLYAELLEMLRRQGSVHVVIGCIALPNEASVRLHRRLGFQDAAVYREVGRKFNQWIDVLTMQLALTCEETGPPGAA